MDVGTWEIVKGFMSYVAYPVMALFGYLFRKQAAEIHSLRLDVAELKIAQAVSTSQIKDIREDIKDLTQVVRDAERVITEDIKILRRDVLNARD